MKRVKRSLSYIFSAVLLLSFSMTLLPLDFLHNHATVQVTCSKDKPNASCTHKLHITKKADYCWACAVHYDKTFTKPGFVEKLRLSPGLSLFINNDTATALLELLFNGLRGPPAE